MTHKARDGGVVLDLDDEPSIRAAEQRLGPPTLVERMAPRGTEVLVAIRRDGLVPVLVVGAGGVHTEQLDDVAVVPLPADEARVTEALETLRTPIPPQPIARLAIALQRLPLALIELNPVIVHGDQRRRRRRAGPRGDDPMNEIAAKLGEVGLPKPVKELAQTTWDAVIVGGGHNGLTAAAYLAKAGQQVLVLERRERLGGACTLERPFADHRYSVSPCAYVVGLLDEVVINELQLRRRGFECYVADPNLWVPFEDGTSFGQWLDDNKTQPNLEQLKVSKQDIDGYWAYEHLFDEIRQRLRTRGRDTWLGETPDARGDRGPAARRADDDRHRLRRLDRRRPRRPPQRPAAQGRALRPGRDRRLRRPEGPRHGVDQAHALPGRPRGPGPGVGLRQGRHGDDQLRDRRRRAGGRRARSRPACRWPRSSPARA